MKEDWESFSVNCQSSHREHCGSLYLSRIVYSKAVQPASKMSRGSKKRGLYVVDHPRYIASSKV